MPTFLDTKFVSHLYMDYMILVLFCYILAAARFYICERALFVMTRYEL